MDDHTIIPLTTAGEVASHETTKLVGALSPVNHRGLYQGYLTLLTVQVYASTSSCKYMDY